MPKEEDVDNCEPWETNFCALSDTYLSEAVAKIVVFAQK